ncbi:MAG: isochorismatase family protein, partial [Deltaproteobacteria bacterium]|nr:isochorismatase family protein [Deltaproteobacteria bacterium]
MGIKPDRKCVIVVDLQADFTEFKNGALKVPGTNEHYLRNVQDAVKRLRDSGFLLVATQDWHPPNHISFFTNHPGKKAFEEISIRERKQILWPPHCVQHTEGATLLLDPELFDSVVRKGQDPLYDSYSAFKDDGGHETGLHT